MLHAKRGCEAKASEQSHTSLGGRWTFVVGERPICTSGRRPAANLPTRTIEPRHELILSEEEVFDVSLATFYVFDRENTTLDSPRLPACQRRLRRRWPRMRRRWGAMDAEAAVATDAAAVDAAAATHLVATVVVASTVAAVAEALEDVAGVAASGGGRRLLFILGRVPVLLDHMGSSPPRHHNPDGQTPHARTNSEQAYGFCPVRVSLPPTRTFVRICPVSGVSERDVTATAPSEEGADAPLIIFRGVLTHP